MTTTMAAPSRLPLAAALATLAVTTVLLPLGRIQLSSTASFVPALIAVVACFDLMSVYLLIGDYRDRGDTRLLVMACAYTWSLIAMGGYALTFPGAVSTHPPLALTPSMAPYFYVFWHGGFPILLGAAWAPWPARWTRPTPEPARVLTAVTLVGTAVATAAALVGGLLLFAHRLPVLIIGLDTSRMTALTAPFTLLLVAVALAITINGTRRRTGPERWSSVVVLVCLCDLVLTYSANHRFSLGWYGGRTLTLIAAGVVLMAMQASFRKLKAQAEHDAVVDALTGLQNRRGTDTAFEQMIARARRSDAPLGVVSFDLDWFKRINDNYGHEAGDDVLAEVGRVLTASCRLGDVVGRVGGEEFLLLLHDTDVDGACAAAEKVRRLVASMTVPSVHEPVTASLGVTVLDTHDLDVATVLRRADAALYEAKRRGRNRVETCLRARPSVAGSAEDRLDDSLAGAGTPAT